MSEEGLDAILDEKGEPDKAADDSAPEGQKQQAAESEQVPPTEPDNQEPEPQTVPLTALEDERRKRQDAESQVNQIRQQLVPQNDEGPAMPDPFDDPEAWQQAQDERFDEKLFGALCNATEQALAHQVGEEDYAKSRDAFAKAAQDNPGLGVSLRQAGNPALYAYQEGQKLIAMAEIGDPATYKERLKAELLAELKGEKPTGDAPEKDAKAKPDELPQSLADEQSQAGRSGPAWDGPPSLDSLLG